ncbi:hypothetical protein CDL12_01495 [Handroanthus impetiginosus]|uniref:Uncharacterized protein n=1 Tax=Handroanthus impetiginosus TaxID=429701 RepID=A0A2G9I7M5_9LAMI|nr:hypothetical protein CDL12_01495 [Handroanthus impetiginosus]
MEGFTKVLLILTLFLGALSMDVKGGRVPKDEVHQPQTFGSFGSGFPNPGSLPNPFLGSGSFPNPSSIPNPLLGGGSIPNPVLGGGSFPNPALGGGSFPNPALGGSNQGLGFGPSAFCAHGVSCPRVQPKSKDGAGVGGTP